MAIRVAINGLGRIGRQALKISTNYAELEVVAINELGDLPNMVYLLKHDTVYRESFKSVTEADGGLVADGESYKVLQIANPADLPWRDLGIDVVIESTGRFTTKEQAEAHIGAGAKAVVVSAPAKGAASFVLGINESNYRPETDKVISNLSCTTNSVAPVMAVLDAAFGVAKALMTTIHSYTADQRLVDSPHKDWRRGRSAAQNIIPTSTGAARAASEALPQLKGIFDGISLRVPTVDVSISDLTVLLKRKTTVEEINRAFKDATQQENYKGILGVTEEPLVSSDFIGNPLSTVVDLQLTQLVDGDLAKVFAWYDNEWGYSNRLVEEVLMVGRAIAG